MIAALFDLTGKTALVTGGSTGLGYAMAEALNAAGARVLISGRRQAMLENAANTLGGNVFFDTVDLYDRVSLDDFVSRTNEKFGGIDIFVGNAGAVHAEQIGGITPGEIDRILQLNLTANITLTQAFLPGMRERGWGRIIFSSSVAATLALPLQGNIMYAATKGGLNAFARSAAADLGRSGITVNTIIFGVFKTELLINAESDVRETGGELQAASFVGSLINMTALGRLGDPADLHGLVLLLASDAGRYITGTSIPLDGGNSIMMGPFPGN